MFRKIILTGLMIFWSRGSIQQLAIGIQVSAFFLVATVKYQPYMTRFNNQFKIVTDAAVLVTFNIAVILSDRVDSSLEPAWSVTQCILSQPSTCQSDPYLTVLRRCDTEMMDAMLIIVNIVIPVSVVIYELAHARLSSDDAEDERYTTVDGLAWPYARWQDGTFRYVTSIMVSLNLKMPRVVPDP